MQKPTKPYDWNPFVKHGAKVLNEEAGVKTPAEAKQQTKPYYVSINGNLTDVNDPEWVARAANSPRDTIQTAGAASAAKPKIVKTPIGNVKIIPETKEFSRNPNDYKKPFKYQSWSGKHTPDESSKDIKIDDDTKRYVMKQEYEARKYKKPMSSSAAILREMISDKAKAKITKEKASKPVEIDFTSDKAFRELEEMHQSRLEADERSRRYHEYIKKTQDPALHKGLASVMGSIPEDFNK